MLEPSDSRNEERDQTAAAFAHPVFEDGFDHLFRVAMGPAFRILRDRDSAEDVAAEALARAYVNWARLGNQTWVEAWIVRVSTNLAIDQVRRAKRPLPRVTVGADGELEVRLDLAHAVARLPRRQRQAIALRYFGDMSEEDVAGLLGISTGSVKTHVHRGIAALRDQLGEGWRDSLAY